ncbi:hypothetical protein QTP88_005914 [Uroleucon formosanum]
MLLGKKLKYNFSLKKCFLFSQYILYLVLSTVEIFKLRHLIRMHIWATGSPLNLLWPTAASPPIHIQIIFTKYQKHVMFNVNFRFLVWDSAYKWLGEYEDRSPLQALQVFHRKQIMENETRAQKLLPPPLKEMFWLRTRLNHLPMFQK